MTLECLSHGFYWQLGRVKEEEASDGHKERMSCLASPLVKAFLAKMVMVMSAERCHDPNGTGCSWTCPMATSKPASCSQVLPAERLDLELLDSQHSLAAMPATSRTPR